MGNYNKYKPFYMSSTQIQKTIGKVQDRSNFNHYTEQFVENALSLFEWTGVPQEIPKYVLEKYLLMFGMMCMYKDYREHILIDEFGNEYTEVEEIYKVAPFTIQFYNDYWDPLS